MDNPDGARILDEVDREAAAFVRASASPRFPNVLLVSPDAGKELLRAAAESDHMEGARLVKYCGMEVRVVPGMPRRFRATYDPTVDESGAGMPFTQWRFGPS